MYRKCATELSARHQREFSQALLSLMETMPYEQITVTDLCRKAGISRRIFYHLFSGKAGALQALVDQAIFQLALYRPEQPGELLRFFGYWREQGPLLDALRSNGLTNVLWERMLEMVFTEDHEVRHWLKSTEEAAPTELIQFGYSGVMGLTYSWYLSGFEKSPEEMARILERMITLPLAPNRSQL